MMCFVQSGMPQAVKPKNRMNIKCWNYKLENVTAQNRPSEAQILPKIGFRLIYRIHIDL